MPCRALLTLPHGRSATPPHQVPRPLLPYLLPPAFGYDPAATVGGAADLFASRGGPLFDRLAATEAAATLVLRALFTPARAHRLAAQVRFGGWPAWKPLRGPASRHLNPTRLAAQVAATQSPLYSPIRPLSYGLSALAPPPAWMASTRAHPGSPTA